MSPEQMEERIGYRFKDRKYLMRALTHSSYSNETGARNHHLLCNERLEFLGDSVLSLITSDYLYKSFPELPEGELTKIRAATVCEEALASYAEQICLGDFLLLGKGEAQCNGAQKPAILADAFEALLAAMYMDAGGMSGMAVVSDFLLPFIKVAVAQIPQTGGGNLDSKSKLQEFVQQDKELKNVLEYRLVGESGPDHNKTFEVELYLGANCIGCGKGHSKKYAEQAAAKAALELFGQI
jgi:ribonuclease-3